MFNCIAVLLAREQGKGITFIQVHRNVFIRTCPEGYCTKFSVWRNPVRPWSVSCTVLQLHILELRLTGNLKKDLFLRFFELSRLLLVINNYKAPYLQRRQPIVTSQHNIAEHNIFRAFGHLVTKCCDMFVTNRAHGLAQHCCTNLAKRLQYHATSTNVAWKIGPFSNLI